MTELDQQIADKIISKLSSADGWSWIPHAYKCSSYGWIGDGALLVKAFKEIGPSDPWNYLCVRLGITEWEVPNELRKSIWEKAWPIFEAVRTKGEESAKLEMLRLL